MKKKSTAKTNYTAPAVDRLLNLVEFLSRQHRPFGVNELSRRLGISTNSIFRIMARMIDRGYAVQDEKTKGYLLTPRLFSLGDVRQDRESIKAFARPHLERLCEQARETVSIQVPVGARLEVLDVVAPRSDFYLQITPGAKVYYHPNAFGKAVLAFMTDEDIRRLLPDELPKLTNHTITNLAELLEDVAAVRKTGVAFDREEYSRGVYCIGAAVLDAAGNPVAGMGITGMKVRFDKYRRKEFVCMVLQTAQRISRDLGYTGNHYETRLPPLNAPTASSLA